MDDRRKLLRRQLIYYLPVFDFESNYLVGHIVDATSQGLMLISIDPIETGKVFHFAMDLPLETGKEHIEFFVRSQWAKSDEENPIFFNTGFELVEIKEKDIHQLVILIKQYGFNMGK